MGAEERIYQLQTDYSLDSNRLYLNGHSFGGRGVLNMLSDSDHQFAAAAAFAPSGNDNSSLNLLNMADTPQWYIVSESDSIVDADSVYELFLEIFSQGENVFTIIRCVTKTSAYK